MNTRSFALRMNMPYTRIFDLTKGRTKTISHSVFLSIKETYHVREEYLLTGEGEMFETYEPAPVQSDTSATCLEMIASLYKENKELKEANTNLQQEIERLKAELEQSVRQNS